MCAVVQLARREREKPLYVILLCTGSVRNAASCLFACAALRCCVQSAQQRLNLLGDTHKLTELLGVSVGASHALTSSPAVASSWDHRSERQIAKMIQRLLKNAMR